MSGRRGRSALLVLAIALATMLSIIVAVSMSSLQAAILKSFDQLVGQADLRIVHEYKGRIPASLVEEARGWDEVEHATAMLDATGVRVINERNEKHAILIARGILPDTHLKLHVVLQLDGRLPRVEDEIMLDQANRDALDAKIGDVLEVDWWGDETKLEVVGFYQRPPTVMFDTTVGLVTLKTAQKLSRYEDAADVISLALKDPDAVDAVRQAHADALPQGVVLQTPATAKSGVRRIIRVMGMTLLGVLVLVYASAGIIVLVSMTTSVAERARELAILRCVGTERSKIVISQLLAGLMVSLLGAVIGTPIGLGIAYLLCRTFRKGLFEAGFQPQWYDVTIAMGAACLAGLLGAVYPALRAGSVQPVAALSIRAHEPKRWTLWLCAILGVVFIAIAPVALLTPIDINVLFWLHIFLGLPLTTIGFFLLSVPVLVLLSWTALPIIAKLLRIPRQLLQGTVMSTPFRHAFTGGALMIGLMLLVATWTVGRSLMHDFLEGVDMPDIFIHGGGNITEEQWKIIQNTEGVALACRTGIIKPELSRLYYGPKQVAVKQINFMTFPPDCLLDIVKLDWIEGSEKEARQGMKAGRGVLVSREFHAKHKMGVGDKVRIDTIEGPVDFHIVGVMTSKGLDIAVQALDVQQQYDQTAISYVFGSVDDGRRYFKRDDVSLVLVKVAKGHDAEVVKTRLEENARVLCVSAEGIITRVRNIALGSMLVSSTIAIASLIIACAGVGTLLVAEITAKRFEYGVLRSIGAMPGMLGRVILAQAIIIGLVGCIVGTAMGLDVALLRQIFVSRLIGVVYQTRVPLDMIAWGWVFVLGFTLLAALGPMVRLLRMPPRELLASDVT